MAIPDRQQPFPGSVRPVFLPGKGISLPSNISIPSLPVHGTPNNPSTPPIQHVARGTGSRTVALVAPNPITIDVPLAGFTTPFQPSQTLNMVADPPVIDLPDGTTLGSVTVKPMVVLVGSGTPIPAGTVGRGVQIKRFLVRVTFSVSGFEAASQSVTVTGAASLYTPSS